MGAVASLQLGRVFPTRGLGRVGGPPMPRPRSGSASFKGCTPPALPSPPGEVDEFVNNVHRDCPFPLQLRSCPWPPALRAEGVWTLPSRQACPRPAFSTGKLAMCLLDFLSEKRYCFSRRQ